MALTREYKTTVMARIKRDPKFARALYAEAVTALLDGETAEGLSMLRDLVHAEITFKELAHQTGFGEKALHRILGRNGNPTTKTPAAILATIREDPTICLSPIPGQGLLPAPEGRAGEGKLDEIGVAGGVAGAGWMRGEG